MTTSMCILRANPFHIGHLKILDIMEKETDELVVCIGSADKSYTPENPFSAEERERMIRLSKKFSKKSTIVHVPDINDYAKYVNHVEELSPEFEIVYTGNQIVKQLFENAGYGIRLLQSNTYISGTLIRDMMFKGQNWQELVPEGTVQVINECDGINRLKDLYRKFRNPIPVVDIIIKYENGIVLIDRKNYPFGKSLVGGHQNYAESLEQSAVREAKEETGLDITLERQFHTYSEPDRDLRGPRPTTVFIAKGKGTLKSGDDALNAFICPLDQIPELVFDHNLILNDYIKQRY
jgi:nicotinamide-nucleotide adenylyltransferase